MVLWILSSCRQPYILAGEISPSQEKGRDWKHWNESISCLVLVLQDCGFIGIYMSGRKSALLYRESLAVVEFVAMCHSCQQCQCKGDYTQLWSVIHKGIWLLQLWASRRAGNIYSGIPEVSSMVSNRTAAGWVVLFWSKDYCRVQPDL